MNSLRLRENPSVNICTLLTTSANSLPGLDKICSRVTVKNLKNPELSKLLS